MTTNDGPARPPLPWLARPLARSWTCGTPEHVRSGAVRAFHASLPGYAPTPLTEVPLLAGELNAGGARATWDQGLNVQLARASIDAKRSCGVAIPYTAIDHLTVQVIKGSTVETRKVRVGLSSDSSTEILEGLDVGEIVVADAGSSLHDGDQVKTMFADELDRRTR